MYMRIHVHKFMNMYIHVHVCTMFRHTCTVFQYPVQGGRIPDGRHRRPHRCCGGKQEIKFISLDQALPSYYEQVAAAGKPAPARGPGIPDLGKYRYLYIVILNPISCTILQTPDIGTCPDIGYYIGSYRDMSRYHLEPCATMIS